MICVVEGVEFTRGSPFGEQWWTLAEEDGPKRRVAMRLDHREDGRWPRIGDTIEIVMTKDLECSLGAQSSIRCSPCADLVKIVKHHEPQKGT